MPDDNQLDANQDHLLSVPPLQAPQDGQVLCVECGRCVGYYVYEHDRCEIVCVVCG